MDSHEVRQILALFRPDTADEQDPSFREARQLAKTDPELARWFDQHCRPALPYAANFKLFQFRRS